MSATIVSSTWAPMPRQPRPAWILGQSLVREGEPPAMQWVMKPNCSLAPRQLGLVYLSLCAVSLLISIFFYAQGATLVAWFAGLELVLVGLALLVFARHAADRETLTLQDGALHVERQVGNHHHSTRLPAHRLTVEPAAGQGSLVELRGPGSDTAALRVGRHLRPDQRDTLAHELRMALRQARSGGCAPASPAPTPSSLPDELH